MIDYSPLISAAGQRLRESQLGRQVSHLNALWCSEIWVPHETQLVGADAELSRDLTKVNVYPSVLNCPTGERELLREFGLLVFNRGGQRAKKLWEQKLVVPSRPAVDAFQFKLKSGNFQRYIDIVQDFKTASDRFVALNLANALIANHVPVKDSVEIDVTTWGPTCEYATGRRRHPMVSILSAYCDTRTYSCYGETFADATLNELRSVRESSVAADFRGLVVELAELAR